jgi:hypothetical protein
MPLLSINLGLPSQPTITDPQMYNEFLRVYNAINNLALAIDLYTGGLPIDETSIAFNSIKEGYRVQNISKIYLKATEAIAFGAMVSISGTFENKIIVKNSVDLNPEPCIGYCSQESGVASGEFGEFTLGPSLHPFFSGLVPGSKYYVSGTAGLVTPAAPSGSGRLLQFLGIALSDTALLFQPDIVGAVVIP